MKSHNIRCSEQNFMTNADRTEDLCEIVAVYMCRLIICIQYVEK